MEPRLQLYREEGERSLPKRLVEVVPRRGGRPKRPVRLSVQTAADVKLLRRKRVPVFLLTAKAVADAGYPMVFEPRVVVPDWMKDEVTSDLQRLTVRDPETLRTPGLETLAVLMLRVDRLAARAILQRNRSLLNPSELYRAVMNEGLAREATRVRLQDFASDIPIVGQTLPANDLARVIQADKSSQRRA